MSDVIAIVDKQWLAGLFPCMSFSNLRKGVTWKLLVLCFATKVLLTSTSFFNSTHYDTLLSQSHLPNQPFFSSPAPSTCLKTSAAWTKIFDLSGKLVLSFEWLLLDCYSGFWTTSSQTIVPALHYAVLFNIAPNGTGFLGSWVNFDSPPNLEVLGYHSEIYSFNTRKQKFY